MTKKFQLTVKQIESTCIFELRWGNAQIISVDLNYPLSLKDNYEQWQRAYLDYYRHVRGKKVISGTGSTPVDRHRKLVTTKEQLLGEFHRWLHSHELRNICQEIANAVSQLSKQKNACVDVFLTCTPIELARLPWETWEISTDAVTNQKIRIARTPATILHETVLPLQRKARVLAIFGDDTGLNLDVDKEALQSLTKIIEVEIFPKNQQKEQKNFDANALKTEIVHAITDARGWDVLFFAGHSNESILTGGEFGIKPGVSLSISELEEPLKQAKKCGLQFAIFNSCSGINIAESLINLGLSQVVVMREQINNQVAQEFLVQFLQSLAKYKDVHESLLDACQFLQQEDKQVSYPSAFLLPSLFRHPQSELFRLQPFGLIPIIKQWLPTAKEISWLTVFLIFSLLPPVQSLLLEPRVLLQAIYRQATWQVPKKVESPVLLVQVDNNSLIADKVEQRYPLDYSYLARIIQKLSQANAKLIGIDYILDQAKQQPQNTQQLSQEIRDAVAKKTWFVFANKKYQDDKKGNVSNEIASLDWSMQGDIPFLLWYVEILPANKHCLETCPFGYLLALSHKLQNQNSSPANLLQPDLTSTIDFRSLVLKPENIRDKQTGFLYQLRLPEISSFLEWFHPIIDFSIPPDKAYNSISTCELLGSCKRKGNIPENLAQKIVIIAPGGYEEAGLEDKGQDNLTIPLAVAFWLGLGNGELPGGEAHAYMVHHLITRRLVIPIPDFFMILLAALLGKGITLVLIDNPSQKRRLLIVLGTTTAVYVIAALQIFITLGVLFPWFLPSMVLWNYVRLILRKNSYAES